MTEQTFWSIVAELGWGTTTTDYKAIEKVLMKRLTREEAEAMRAHLDAAESRVYKALDQWQREGDYDSRYMGSDDGFGDLIAHIVGLGREEVDAVIADPARAKKRYDASDFRESFSYAIPSADDYGYLSTETYVKRAKRLLEEGFPYKVNDYYSETSVPLPMSINIETDLDEVKVVVTQVKADCGLVARSLRELADGDLDAFRGSRGKLASEAVERINQACPCASFHPAAITNIVSDIAQYIDS
jgi:hypothetical protein